MKKVLFGTSALVAAGLFAGQAVAAEPISLSIGGKQEQYFGGVGFHETGGGISDSFGIASDTELYFTGSTTLDNGITVRAVIQMEATLGTGAPDEQYVDLSGSFGRIRAGIKEGVFDSSAVEAPGVGEVSLADVTGWVGTTVNGTDPNGLDVTNTSDQASVSYFTPTFMGLQLGGSYIPDVAEANINDPGVLLTTGAEN
ncbi:MAG: porin, partial [Rhodospirillaceae bacterium]